MATPSLGNNGDGTSTPFGLFHTPKRERRVESTDSPLLPDRWSRSLLIRMVAAPILLATLVLFASPFQQQVLFERHNSSLSRNNVVPMIFHNLTSNSTKSNESFPDRSDSYALRVSTKVSTPAEESMLSEESWQGLLKWYRKAMQTQSFDIVWLPLIIQDRRMLVAQKHLTRAQNERGRRFGLFISMMRQALLLRSNMLVSSQTVKRNESSHESLLLDEKWRKRPIPMLMALGDQRRCENKPFPRFGWCTLKDDQCRMFVLPSYNVYRDAPESSQGYDTFHESREQQYPWSKKRRQAVWRGSATGRIKNDWTDLPRAQLVNVSIHNPDLLDAAFVHAKQFNRMYPLQEAQLRNHSRFANWIAFQDFQKYRAVVDIDGNAWSDRFGNLLCLNSAVVKVSQVPSTAHCGYVDTANLNNTNNTRFSLVKVQPSNENYFFQELKPWVHYIPVAANMSDIEESLRFAISNRTARKVQRIVFRANEWCRTRLTKSSLAKDIFQTLNSYLRLLGTNETRWRQWEKIFEVYRSNMTLVEPPR